MSYKKVSLPLGRDETVGSMLQECLWKKLSDFIGCVVTNTPSGT
jgi:hypothetical protein